MLFVFVQEHKLFLQTGYGLEGVLPDALCKRIIDEQITPRFKAGDFDGGPGGGVAAILAATKGEYKGTGRTVAEHHQGSGIGTIVLIVAVILLVILRSRSYRSGGIQYLGRWLVRWQFVGLGRGWRGWRRRLFRRGRQQRRRRRGGSW